ncbi:MAG: SPFH domain-containing protein [Clostridiales Family XIII bacterium]|jgi:membrane protease subunit (stomatin/prohibitin family)|nr:SPFH domain-containing protein [Clostridiales Family XIII bacterium]
MGLLKAAVTAVGSAMADQWKEFIQVDSMSSDLLLQKGHPRSTSAAQSTLSNPSNTQGSRDVISRDSKLLVNDGQALLVVENGKIVDFTVEAGEYIFDKSSEPSLFAGGFGKNLKDTFANIGKRFTMGGDVANMQVAYYVNIKELIDNKFGSAQPVPYNDRNYGTVVYVRYFGTYSLRIVDPLRFYANISGNVTESFRMKELETQIESEFYTALNTALGTLATQGVSFADLTAKQMELADLMNNVLDGPWRNERGFEISRVGITGITPDDETRERIQKFDQARMVGSSSAASAGTMTQAQAAALENMGKQEGGASGMDALGMTMGMMGMNMMNQQMQQMQNPQMNPAAAPVQPVPPVAPIPVAGTWTCVKCGTNNDANFCKACGSPKPSTDWACDCGAVNDGNFCKNCGKPRP